MFSLIKGINRLISKGMYVLLSDVFNRCLVSWKKLIGMSNIYYYEKLTFLKLQFYRKEDLKKYTTFEEQKGTRYIRRNAYFGIIAFSCLSFAKSCLRFFLIFFDQEIKGFYQSYLGNEVDFTDIMNVSPNILAKN